MRTYTSYKKDFATFSGNTSTTSNSTNALDNLSWGSEMINDGIRYLATMFYFNEVPYIVPGGTVANQQGYQLPGDFESLMNVTVNVGSILYQPKESPSRRHFDALNVIQFYNDFPQFFYIFNGKLNLYPTPASDGNVITINYKRRVTDLAMEDVTNTTSSATVSVTTNTTTVTASGNAFTNWMGISGWIRIPYSSVNATNGDNKWYQIASVTNATTLELKNPYTGATVIGGNFTIGDVPILPEDYQDLPLYRALRLYYTTRVLDEIKATNYKGMYDEGYALLDAKYGSKTISPVLTDTESPVFNPNLFPRNLS